MTVNLNKLNQLKNLGLGGYVPKFKEATGNVFKTFNTTNHFDVMVLNMNCFNAMGAGYLKVADSMFPELRKALGETKSGDVNKLGKFIDVPVETETGMKNIVLIFGQYAYGKSTMRPEDRETGTGLIHLDHLSSSFGGAINRYSSSRICMPQFGLGSFPTSEQDINNVLDLWLEHFPKAKLTIYKVKQ